MLNSPSHRTWRTATPFRLRDVIVYPASNEIALAGRRVRLKPRLMDVLLRLAVDPGQTVTRQSLLDDVWPRRMVNDDVLSRVIADLRNALHDDARGARYIETIPKVGYRLIAPKSLPDAGSAMADGGNAGVAASGSPRPFRTPAVLMGVLAASIIVVIAIVLRLPRESPGFEQLRAGLESQLARAESFSSEPGLELRPRFSPDGARIAFAHATGDRARIVLRDIVSGDTRLLGDPAEASLSPMFFPDGKRIAYFRRNQTGDCSINEVGVDGAGAKVLVGCARRPQADFDLSADGKRIAFVAVTRPQFPAGIIEHDLATGAERIVTAPEPESGDDQSPRYSPDGKRIAFFRGTQSHRHLWLVDATDPATARVAGSPSGLTYGAAWLGRDGPLLVAADWSGQRALQLVDPADGTTVMVGARGARHPDTDQRGNVVYEHATYAANLYLVDPGTTDPPHELWPSTRYTNQQEYSPDGREVLFVSNRDGVSGIFVGTPDRSAQARRIELSGDYLYMRPHWSQDGRAIYAVRARRVDGGTRTQQAIRIAWPAGTVESLAGLGDAVYDVREADAGRALIVGELSGNAARLWRTLPAAPSLQERLPLPLASEYQVQGNQIAFAQPRLQGVTLCDLASLRCASLQLPIHDDNRFDWLLTADAVWYVASGPAPELVRHDLATGTINWRSGFAPTAYGLAIAVRPDGRALLVARAAPPVIDLMLARRPPR